MTVKYDGSTQKFIRGFDAEALRLFQLKCAYEGKPLNQRLNELMWQDVKDFRDPLEQPEPEPQPAENN